MLWIDETAQKEIQVESLKLDVTLLTSWWTMPFLWFFPESVWSLLLCDEVWWLDDSWVEVAAIFWLWDRDWPSLGLDRWWWRWVLAWVGLCEEIKKTTVSLTKPLQTKEGTGWLKIHYKTNYRLCVSSNLKTQHFHHMLYILPVLSSNQSKLRSVAYNITTWYS